MCVQDAILILKAASSAWNTFSLLKHEHINTEVKN